MKKNLVNSLIAGTGSPLIGAKVHCGIDSTKGVTSLLHSIFVNSNSSTFLGTTSTYIDKGLLYLGIMGLLLVIWLLLHYKT